MKESPDLVLDEEESHSRIDLVQLALRYKWLLLLSGIGGLVLGQAAYMKLGPMHEAGTRVLVSKKAAVPMRGEDGEARTWGERGEHIALIMSPMIVGKAVEMHDLDTLPSLAGKEHAAEAIVDDLVVKRKAGRDRSFLNVFEITYKSPRAADAEKVVDAVVDAYRAYLEETHKEQTGKLTQLIERARTDLHEELKQKEQQYLEFRKQAPLIWKNPPGTEGAPGEVTNVHQERVVAIEQERRKNMLQQAEIKSKIRAIEQAREQGESRESLEMLVRRFVQGEAPQATASGLPGQDDESGLEANLLPLLLEEQRLLRDYGPDHPDVQRVRESIETVRAFYRRRGVRVPDELSGGPEKRIDFVSLYLDSLRQQLNELELRDAQLAERFEHESQLAKKFSRYQIKDQALTEEITRIKSLWEAIVSRLNELNLVKAQSGYDVRQIAPVRSGLVAKRHFKFLGGGLFAGLLLATGLIYLREWSDTTLKSAEEIQDRLHLPVLGGVPEFGSDESPLVAGKPRTKLPLVGDDARSPLCVAAHPESPEAEAFRSVRTALFVSSRSKQARIIEISSPEPGDGKTTCAANLAMAVAQSRKKVLLVDADLRKPAVHSVLNIENGVGLSDVLLGEVDSLTAARETQVPGLSVLTAGTPPANPSELLTSGRLQQVLEEAGRYFDYVFIDTPPLLVVSDPCIIAPHTDGLLLVLRIAKNARASVHQACEVLQTHDVRLLGSVANGTVIPRKKYYGYFYGDADRAHAPGQAASPETGRTVIAGEKAEAASPAAPV